MSALEKTEYYRAILELWLERFAIALLVVALGWLFPVTIHAYWHSTFVVGFMFVFVLPVDILALVMAVWLHRETSQYITWRNDRDQS